jgi:hypothetical protein
MAVSDRELRRLVTCENGGFMFDVVELARELLAARKVVRAAPKLLSATTTVIFDDAVVALQAALDAYDRARKG